MPSADCEPDQADTECEREERDRPCEDVEAFGGRCRQNFLAVLMTIESNYLSAGLALVDHSVDVMAHRYRKTASRHVAVGDRQTAAALAGQTLRNLRIRWFFRSARFTCNVPSVRHNKNESCSH